MHTTTKYRLSQIKLTGAGYGDFVLWSPDEQVMLRIEQDDDFIVQALDNAQHSLSMEFCLNSLANGTLKHQYTDKFWLQLKHRSLVLTCQNWDPLPRMVRFGAIAEAKMKGR